MAHGYPWAILRLVGLETCRNRVFEINHRVGFACFVNETDTHSCTFNKSSFVVIGG